MEALKQRLIEAWENKSFRYGVLTIVGGAVAWVVFSSIFLREDVRNPLEPTAVTKQGGSAPSKRSDPKKSRPVSLFATDEELTKLDTAKVEELMQAGAKDLQQREMELVSREKELKEQLAAQADQMAKLELALKDQERRLSQLTASPRYPQGQDGRRGGQPVAVGAPQQPVQPGVIGQTRLTQPGVIEHTPTTVLIRQPQVEGEMIRTITQRSVRQVKQTGQIEERGYEVSRVAESTDTITTASSAANKDGADKEDKKKSGGKATEEKGIYIPAGSFFQAVTITGVDAPTQLAAKAAPRPVIVRIKKEAILPNHFQVDIRECHAVVETTGDLSSERAFMRTNVLSCVRNDGRSVEAQIHAQAVSEYDGRLGIAGRLVSKNGSALAGAMASGFMSGLSEAMAPQRVGSVNTEPGEQALYETIDMAQLGSSAAFNGASNALDKLADYYIALADQIHPVIEINPGRKVTFVTLQGVNLKLK